MNIFSFFKKATKTGADSTVDSSELIEDAFPPNEEKNEVSTNLSISHEWRISKEQEYVLKFLSNDLPPLKADQLSLAGIDIDQDEKSGNWHVQAFLRSSLDRPIKLGKAELMILDANSNVLAAQEFDLSQIGDMPAFSNRPWIFIFEKNNIQKPEPPIDDWTIAFNVRSLVPHTLDLDPSWDEALPENQKIALRELVNGLPELKPREVNITGFRSQFTEDGGLAASVFIRNGHTRHIQLDKIPLEILDAAGKQVAKGSFKLESLTIKANTSKPWTFIFPKEMLQTENPDLSRWTARILK
jgi:accessory Sec system S-layer assembly protein